MAYSRWGSGSVYFFKHVGGGFECQGLGEDGACNISNPTRLWSYEDAIRHLESHGKAGERALSRLRSEACPECHGRGCKECGRVGLADVDRYWMKVTAQELATVRARRRAEGR